MISANICAFVFEGMRSAKASCWSRQRTKGHNRRRATIVRSCERTYSDDYIEPADGKQTSKKEVKKQSKKQCICKRWAYSRGRKKELETKKQRVRMCSKYAAGYADAAAADAVGASSRIAASTQR
jgi:hypothetical protein